MKCALLCIALVAASPLVQAQKFEPTTQLGGNTCNSTARACVRYRVVVPVYEMGLYTTRKVTTPEQLLSAPGPKRASFVALRDFPGDQMGLSLVRGMRDNADPAHAAAVAGYMDKLGRIFSTEKKIAAGQTFPLDYVPGQGTAFLINGVQKGETVTEPGFLDAVLRIWVGPRPVDAQLKDLLLGAPPKKSDPNMSG